jgi:phosphoribosylformimino-5-aminoimidazole carboxamide ribotide isomerase
VIDLRQGLAVHAIAGHRDAYRPVIATGINDGDAIALAARYQRLGIQPLYIADIDAIQGNAPNRHLLASLASLSQQIFVDAGSAVTDIAKTKANTIAINDHCRWILPTECYHSAAQWAADCRGLLSEHRVVMGLDITANQMRSRNQQPQSTDLIENIGPWIDQAMELGVDSFVLLDLSFVGTRQGAAVASQCKRIADVWPTARIISGGGIRDSIDVQAMVDAGCDLVLVGTALHHDDTAQCLIQPRTH